MTVGFLPRELPEPLRPLAELALDLRWTWSHAGDSLWRRLDPEAWARTKNPWVILQDVPHSRLEELSGDPGFVERLGDLASARAAYLTGTCWCGETQAELGLRPVAYFSMEFGVGEALPLYAGGLGVLAGDYLKTASDLGVPLVGIGLLYQEGYFRQMLDAEGGQQEAYPYNDPSSLPIRPVLADGGWLHVSIEFPGRTLLLRVWQAQVGRVTLYLLDSNDPLNGPIDRGITGKLYGGGREMRLMQEIVLGIGGARLIETLGLEAEVYHLNEGHAAFAVLERARAFMRRSGLSFWEALWATRAGNVFTTHTSVGAGFDTFDPGLIRKYFPFVRDLVAQLGVGMGELLGLGRRDPGDATEPFNMTYLAMRGCSLAIGVSRLHGAVSRRLFRRLYPRWPEPEVPVGHITNGIHVPSWDSPWADAVWTELCGKERWRGAVDTLGGAIERIPDERLWAFRADERRDLVGFARARLARQLGEQGAGPDLVAEAQGALDPNVLTLGFARRFAEYKRPGLLLRDPARLARLLTDPRRPVQLIVAGKAHPDDAEGKRLLRAWAVFARRPELRHRVVFLEDYDMILAQELVQGVDVWINTPRRPWEACGTSGMKVLVNGGLNLSELDGWWDEAYAPEFGWALGDRAEHPEAGWDAVESERMCDLIEREIVPSFYERDAAGVPRAWVARIRASMARLAPRFSSNRMVCEHTERLYAPATQEFRRRAADGGRVAKALYAWQTRLRRHWDDLRLDSPELRRDGDNWVFTVAVYLGDLTADDVAVELYADPADGGGPAPTAMTRAEPIVGAANGHLYRGRVPAARPADHYSVRVRPHRDGVRVPMELPLVLWQR